MRHPIIRKVFFGENNIFEDLGLPSDKQVQVADSAMSFLLFSLLVSRFGFIKQLGLLLFRFWID